MQKNKSSTAIKRWLQVSLIVFGLIVFGASEVIPDINEIVVEPKIEVSNEAVVLPTARPDRKSLYPQTPRSLEAGYKTRFGEFPQERAVKLNLKNGENITNLLKRGGLNGKEAYQVTEQVKAHLSLKSLPIGYEVTMLAPKENQLAALRFTLADDFDLTLFATSDGSWHEELSVRPIGYSRDYTSGAIETSFYEAGLEAGMSDEMVTNFARILGFSVDFQRQIRKGDSFEVLFDTKHDLISGKATPLSDLDYVAMNLSGKPLEFFYYELQDGTKGWYDTRGNNAALPLMRTPINGARLSSGYGKRMHPILGYSKMHRGLDFAAPTGTPIMAAGRGVVEVAKRNGAYGNYIRIRHNDTYKTAYAHLSKYAKGVRRGARVNQGDIIGYVGSTGRSTGPHLHYEIIINNRQVNPLRVELPSGIPLPENERKRFFQTVEAIRNELLTHNPLHFAEQ